MAPDQRDSMTETEASARPGASAPFSEPRARPSLPPMPDRIKALPLNRQGYPVPWFVAWINGEPDFRVIGPGKIAEAHNKHLCWICGKPLARNFAFVIGPMCAINRVSAEPPSHMDCAIFSAMACPFLTRPKAKRRDAGLPEDAEDPAGEMLTRNPGVALVWLTRSYKPFRAHQNQGDPAANEGVLFQVGDPHHTLWFAEGRKATRAEVMASIDSGFPLLHDIAKQEGDDACEELYRMRARAMFFVPESAAP